MSATGWRDAAVLVRAPATSANLGPGFDALGLALTLHDQVRARVTSGGLRLSVTGAGEATAADGEGHLVVRAMRAAFDVIGGQPPGLDLRCRNAIPQGFGLGSSAAAIVTGALAARALAGDAGRARLTDAAVLDLAAGLEGHADNVAACLAGGLTIAWLQERAGPDGRPGAGARSVRVPPVPALAPVVCVPATPMATSQARQVLPAVVSHADAASTAGRAALLIAALAFEPAALLAATRDLLHQPYRAAAMPASADLIAVLRAAGVPAVLSGAGPSVLALSVEGTHPGADTVRRIAGEQTAGTWDVLPLPVDHDGAAILPGAAA